MTSFAFQRAEQVTLGVGLFPTVSLLNHSCNPAMELVFYGNSCTVRAIRNVEEGNRASLNSSFCLNSNKRIPTPIPQCVKGMHEIEIILWHDFISFLFLFFLSDSEMF